MLAYLDLIHVLILGSIQIFEYIHKYLLIMDVFVYYYLYMWRVVLVGAYLMPTSRS